MPSQLAGRVAVRVWGDRACFTRPETRTERLTYPVMTPSAAAGMLEAILWRPAMHWRVREIWLLKPVQYFSELRNEIKHAPIPDKVLKSKAAYAKSLMRAYEKPYSASENRLQRHTCGLLDVDYVIVADPVPHERTPQEVQKYVDMFEDRIKLGRCFHRPYFGQRDWSAYFSPVPANTQPLPADMQLGRIMFGKRYLPDQPAISVFFEASIKKGVLAVPDELYEVTLGCA